MTLNLKGDFGFVLGFVVGGGGGGAICPFISIGSKNWACICT